jgi:hypothetical protein
MLSLLKIKNIKLMEWIAKDKLKEIKNKVGLERINNNKKNILNFMKNIEILMININ